MLKIENVSKQYGDHLVLKDINLDIQSHEAIHISGINGSGKSTLLKLITGLIQPDCGSVIIDAQTKIGGLIENPSFVKVYRAKENIDLLFKLVSKDNFDENHLNDLFKMFKLDYYDSRPISKYSLGMLQKLGIIQAVMENQNLIVLDEPSRGLDDISHQRFCELINTLVQEGKSVIIVSHDFESLKEIKFTKRYVIDNHELKAF